MTDTKDDMYPEPNSKWQHTNGQVYEVMLISNLYTVLPDQYPITVVYEGKNGRVWSRPLSDWHRSMTLIEDAP